MSKHQATSTVLLKHHLKALKLPTMHAECEAVAARCAKENVDHLGFLLQLCERELLEREGRAARRRLKAARFPTVKTLEGFNFAAAPRLNKPLVPELLRCDYLDRRENLLLVGGPGTGKTHLATALGVEACGRGRRVRFYRVTELVTQLLEAREERQPGRLRSQLAKLDLLILDELGYVPASKAGAESPFDVISTAYANERDRDDEPAVRAVAGGAVERAADRGGVGSPGASLPDPGDGGRERSPERRQEASPLAGR